MRESHAFRVRFSFSHVRVFSGSFRVQFSHVRVFSDSRNMQKRATKSGTSGHCLVALLVLVAKLVLFALR